MTLSLDPPILRGGLVIAAVARRHVWHLAAGGALTAAGWKDPVAVLMHDGRVLHGIDMTGNRLTPEAAAAVLPGAEAALMAAWRAAFGTPAPDDPARHPAEPRALSAAPDAGETA
jgi:hypothetical protein